MQNLAKFARESQKNEKNLLFRTMFARARAVSHTVRASITALEILFDETKKMIKLDQGIYVARVQKN